MATKPTTDQLLELSAFLHGCERAAIPPPPPAPPVAVAARPRGLLDYAFAPSPAPLPKPQSLLSIALMGKQHPETLADVLRQETPPFESAETLGHDRPARVKQLKAWLARFPAFLWMNKQAAIRGGLQAFQRVQQRRKADAKFSDDLALFRYWDLVVFAVMILNSRPLPLPLAHERQKALAARLLGKMAKSTTLLRNAGVGYPESDGLFTALDKLESLAALKRRQRTDAFKPDREYVKNLAWHATQVFGDASPLLVCELAALKVRNPDKTVITKLVSQYKRGALAAKSAKV
jgi:hypothetical protein